MVRRTGRDLACTEVRWCWSPRHLALDLRAGYNIYQSTKNAFNVAVEVTPGFFDGGTVTGVGLQVGWQAL